MKRVRPDGTITNWWKFPTNKGEKVYIIQTSSGFIVCKYFTEVCDHFDGSKTVFNMVFESKDVDVYQELKTGTYIIGLDRITNLEAN